MPDINLYTPQQDNSVSQPGNIIDPTTGLEMTKRTRGKYVPVPTKEDIESSKMAYQYSNINTNNDINYRPFLESVGGRSKYDEELKPTQLDQLIKEGDSASKLEEYRSDLQGSIPAFGNSLVKLAAKTGINVLGGTAGTVYGLANAAIQGNINGLWDNEAIQELDGWSKSLDAAMPVYKSSDYTNANFLEKMIHPVMFSDELSDAISFTAGAVITEMLTAGLGSAMIGAKATGTLSKLMNGLEVVNKAKSTAIKGLGLEALVFGRRVLTGANYEASVEANQAKNDYKQLAVQDYMKANGLENPEDVPESEMNKIEEDGNNVGLRTWGQNLAILHASNMIQFPKTFGNTFNTAKALLPKGAVRLGESVGFGKTGVSGVRVGLDDVATASYKSLTRPERFLSNAYRFAKNGVTEGLWEEGMQTTVSETNKNYWRNKYNSGNINDAVDYADSFGEGLNKSYGTKEGWNSIGMGMLIGMMGAPGKGILPGKLGVDKQTGKRGDIWQGGVVGEFKNRSKEREYADKMAMEYNTKANNALFSPTIRAGIEQLTAEQHNSTEANSALENDDKFGFQNSKDDSFFEFVNTRAKLGRGDTVDDYLDNLEKLSPEEFKKANYDDTDTKVIDKQEQQKIIAGLRDKVNKIKARRQVVDSIVQTNPSLNYDEATEAYKDQLTYLMSKADMVDIRTDQLVNKISALTGEYLNGRTVKEYSDLAAKTRTDGKTVTRLKNHIRGLNLLTKKLEKNEPILTSKIEELDSENKVLSESMDKSLKERDTILKKIQKLTDNKDVVAGETNSIQNEIDALHDDIKVIDREIDSNKNKLSKNKEQQDKHKEQLRVDRLNLFDSQKEYDAFVKENYAKLKEKSDKKSTDNPEFKYDDFGQYVEDLDELLRTSSSLEKTLKDVYDKDPLKAEELAPLVGDLGKLTKMRYDLIDAYNLHRSSNGRALFMAALSEESENMKNKILSDAQKFDDIKNKLKLNGVYRVNVKNNSGEVEEVLGVGIQMDNGSIGLGLMTKNKEVIAKLSIKDVYNQIRSGFIQDFKEFTEEEKADNKEKEEVKTIPGINKDNGEYSLTGVLVENDESQYLLVTDKDKDGVVHERYYELDENGNVEANYETSLEGEIKVIRQESTHIFNGQLYSYTSEKGLTSVGVLVDVSPFLDEDKVNDFKTYPKSLIINYPDGTTSKPITDKSKIIEIVDLANKANEDPNARLRNKKPVFEYNKKEVTASYTLTKTVKSTRRVKNRKGKGYRLKTNYLHFKQGEEKMSAYHLSPKDMSLEELISSEEPLTNSLFHKPTSTNKNNLHVSNFAEAEGKTEIIQDRYLGSDGNFYTIVRYKDELYAVPRKQLFYQIDEETGLIKSYPVNFNPKKLTPIGYDTEPELSKDTKEEELSSDLRMGKLLADLFYTAGKELEYIENAGKNGKPYYTNMYDVDGNVIKNQIPSQQRWFSFVKDKKITVEEFKDKYKLRIVINNGEFDEVYDKDDAESPSTDDVIVGGKVVKGQEDKVDIRVVLVDKKTNEPIKDSDGKMIFTSIHTSEYKGVEQSDIEAKKKEMSDFRKAVITKLNEDPKAEVYTDILDLSAGSVITEKPTEESVGDTGNTYKARQRNPVKGRIIKESDNFNSIDWGIVKVIPNSKTVVGVTIGNSELNNYSNENGMVFTAISDRNGNPLKVKLLTRGLNQGESNTVAYMLRQYANGETQINGNLILPTKDGMSNPTERPLISRLIRWGSNNNSKDTQIYFDKKGTLHVGNDLYKFGTKDKEGTININTQEGLQILVDWLSAKKIAHVSEKFKGETNFISYNYNSETKEFESKSWNNYNEYLFSDENGRVPILTTDVIKLDDSGNNSNQLAQVNIKFSTDGFIVKLEKKPSAINNPKSTTKQDDATTEEQDIPDELVSRVSNEYEKKVAELQKDGHKLPTIGARKPIIEQFKDEFKAIGIDFNGLVLADIIEYAKTMSATEQVSEAFDIGHDSGASVSDFIAEEEPTKNSFETGATKKEATKSIKERKNKFRLINTTKPYTKEDISTSKAWFNNNLPNIPISYELASELSKNKAWGRFNEATGVLVSNIAKEGTTYHEAFHVVSSLGLSKFDRTAMYNAVRKELNNSKLTNKECEEILADDFMNWKLNGKSEIFAKSDTKRGFFEKILDFVNKMFNYFKTDFDGLKLYSQIDNGKFSNIKLKKNSRGKDSYRLEGLSVEQSEDLLGGIAYNSLSKLYERYNAELSRFGDYADSIIKEVIDDITKDEDVTSEIKAYVSNPANRTNLANGIKQYLEYIGIGINTKISESEIDPLEELVEEDQLVSDNVSNAFAESVMFSSLKNMSNEIKLLIATLPVVEVIGGKTYDVLNSVRLPKIVEFGKTYMTILDALNGTQEIDGHVGMKAKLLELSKTNPEIEVLLARLNALSGDQSVKTWMQFRQAFSLNKYDFQMLLINDGVVKFTQSNRTKASDKVKELWNNGYKESKAFNEIKNNKFISVKQVLGAYLDVINDPKKSINERIDNTTKALKYLGINVSEHLLSNPTILKEAKLVINNFYSRKEPIYDLTKQFQEGRYTALAEAQAKLYQLFLEPQHLNPENKSIYEYSLNNYITTILNEIRQCSLLPTSEERIDRFRKELPHLWGVQEYSTWVQAIINDLQQNIPKLSLGISFLEGTKAENSGLDGRVTNDLSETSLANMHLHSIFNMRGSEFYPMFPLRRPSDKTLEPALSGLSFVKDYDVFENNMLRYLKFELDKVNGDVDKLFIFGRSPENVGGNIILSTSTLKKMANYDGKATNVLEIPKVRDLIRNDIRNFFNKKVEENLMYLSELGVLRRNGSTISDELLDVYKNDVQKLVEDFTMNWTTSAFEQSFLFHGDFAQYKDFFKRTSGYVGTGKNLSRDEIVNSKIQNGIIEFLREEKSKGKDISNRLDLALKLNNTQRKEFPEFNKITDDKNTINSTNISPIKNTNLPSSYYTDGIYKKMLERVILNTKQGKLTNEQIKNYLSAYEDMIVADGLGYITLEEYRNFLLKTGDWNLLGEQEVAYQKVIRGEKLSLDEVSYFPVIKPQGFGVKAYQNLVDEYGNIISSQYESVDYKIAFEKLSLIPLIPTVIENLEMDNLLKSMQRSGVTVAITEKGLPVGKEGAVEFTGENIESLPSFNMDMRYWKIQVDMHDDIADEDTDGTQQRKLLWQDLFEYGKPLNPKFDSLYKDYTDNYQKLIDIEKENLLRELSITESNGVYTVNDFDKFTNAIKREISSRRLPSNILNALSTNENGEMTFPIDSLPVASKIENILLARVNNNLIKLKRPGSAYTQTSNLYWKSNENPTAQQQIKVRQYAETLKFIRLGEDGRIVGAEVMLPASWLGGFIKEGDDIDQLIKQGKLDERLLHVLGYRIPTQGQNSMLPLIIKGFLPAEMGDTIIVPYEIVAQSGSDFDIDKLHIFRPNYVKRDGKLVYVEDNTKSGIEQDIRDLNKLLDDKTTDLKVTNRLIYEVFGITREELESEKKNLNKLLNNRVEKMLLQNKLLEIQLEVLTDPLNIRNLIVPNGADFLKEEADFTIFLKTVVANKDVIPQSVSKNMDGFKRWRNNRKEAPLNPDTLISFKHEIKTALSFKGGKKGVGIIANQITAHSLFQQADTMLSGKIKVKTVDENQNVVWEEKDVILNFHHNSSNGKPSLAGIYDVSGNLISEVNSEHLTGNVDIAKDPFIFTLNTNGLTSNVKYMLLNLGADREWVNRFINQPIIEEYIKQRMINESIEIQATRGDENSDYLSDEDILYDLWVKYGGNSKVDRYEIKDKLLILHNNKKFHNTEELSKYIAIGANPNIAGEMENIFNSAQLQLLADFTSYQEYGRAFNSGIQAIKPDTRRVKNMDDAQKILDDIQNVSNVGFFENVDSMLEGSLLKGFNSVHAKFMKALYKSLFVTELDDVQSKIYSKVKEDITLHGSVVTQKENDLIKQGILTYLFQIAVNRYISKIRGNPNSATISRPISKDRIDRLMIGENSVARLIQRAIENNSNDNIVIKDLIYPQLSEIDGGIDAVKTINKKVDAYSADRFAEALEELYEQSPDAYNKLLEVAAIQFGMTGSSISYMKYFDSKRIGEIFAPVINQLMKDSDFDGLFSDIDGFLDSLYLINRSNRKLIPKVKINRFSDYPSNDKVWAKNHDVILVNPESNLYGRRFIKMNKLVKDANGNEMRTDIVYKKELLATTTSGGRDTNQLVYIKVNIRGGYNLKEFFTGDESSDVNNKDGVATISDTTRKQILDYYKGGEYKSADIITKEELAKSIDDRISETAKWQDKYCK